MGAVGTLSFSVTFLVILMMGFGPRTLSRFQQPYNLNATSEMTIELVDAPVVLDVNQKLDVKNRFGNPDVAGRGKGTVPSVNTGLLAAAQADTTAVPKTEEPQWIQTKGPGGVSNPGLFLASDQTLYLIAKTGLYRLTKKADAWTFVSSSGPSREFSPVMTERGDTLYILTPDEVLISTDRGKTWDSFCERPQGRAIALVITDAPQDHSTQNTDMTMYLVLRTEVFRSEDAGERWEFIGHVLRSEVVPDTDGINFRIWDALAVDNTLFVGTSHGLFRFTDNWTKLPVPTPQGVKSLSVAEDRLYVGTIIRPRQGPDWSPHARICYSTDLGISWTDITPDTHQHPVKLIAAVEVVPVGDTLMVGGSSGVLLSYDRGKTWMDPGRDSQTSGAFAIIALDERNFYQVSYHPSEIIRSTDGGFTWHPFMTGLVSADVQSLIAGKNVLYAVTEGKIAKSADSGESWETLNMRDEGKLLIPRIGTTNDTLYVSSIANNRTQLFHLPVGSNTLAPVQGMPDFDDDNLYVEWKKRVREARETNVNVRETERLWRESLPLIAKEDITNGGFTLAGETIFMEHRRKLFRWRPGETAWHHTGLEDQGELPPIDSKGFTLTASGDTIYAGKREGDLFRSLDGGDTWNDITENLAFPFGYFKEIVCADSTIYISTDMGVMRSLDGAVWQALTDTDGNPLLMDWIATDASILYGVCDSGMYQVDDQTNIWERITSEAPYAATSLAVDGNTLYIGTKHSGVFRLQPIN